MSDEETVLTFEEAYSLLAEDMPDLRTEDQAYDYALESIQQIGHGLRRAAKRRRRNHFIAYASALVFKLVHALEAIGREGDGFLVRFDQQTKPPGGAA